MVKQEASEVLVFASSKDDSHQRELPKTKSILPSLSFSPPLGSYGLMSKLLNPTEPNDLYLPGILNVFYLTHSSQVCLGGDDVYVLQREKH